MPRDQLWVSLMPKMVVFYLILFNGIDQWFGCYGVPAWNSASVQTGAARHSHSHARGTERLAVRVAKEIVAETLVFLKVPTTGAGWQSHCLEAPPGGSASLQSELV